MLHLHLGRIATFLVSFSHFQADRLMFAIHLVHGMHPEMFEAKVIIFALCFYFVVVVLLFCNNKDILYYVFVCSHLHGAA